MASKPKKTTVTTNTPVIVVVVVIVLCVLSMVAAAIIAVGMGIIVYRRTDVSSPVIVSNDNDKTTPVVSIVTPSTAASPWSRLLDREYQEYVMDGQVSEVPFAGSPRLGTADAPVTIVEFTDFECPFCKRHWSEVESVLETQYVKTNKLQRVIKHLIVVPTHNPAARQEALGAFCADRQGSFASYYEALFKGSRGNGLGYEAKRGSVDSLVGLASELRLNTDDFRSCLQTAAGASQIDRDTQLAQALLKSTKSSQQVLGTPAFWICRTNDCRYGTMVLGALPATVFMKVIDYYLQTSR